MITSSTIKLIKNLHPIKSKVCLDLYKRPCVGYGHKLTFGEIFDTYFLKWIIGLKTYPWEAETFLLLDLDKIDHFLSNFNLTPNQTSGLSAFIYDLGMRKFLTTKVHQCLIMGELRKAGSYMTQYVTVKKKIIAGLVTRRHAEQAVFFK